MVYVCTYVWSVHATKPIWAEKTVPALHHKNPSEGCIEFYISLCFFCIKFYSTIWNNNIKESYFVTKLCARFCTLRIFLWTGILNYFNGRHLAWETTFKSCHKCYIWVWPVKCRYTQGQPCIPVLCEEQTLCMWSSHSLTVYKGWAPYWSFSFFHSFNLLL